ncbi:hypothetical protein [Streptomyces blattellae]|uniref:hypothetical protein n=1 Tax=Streptomyces blattellae TaxID=2569855 RepID=UPI0012B8C823|nr:hypothetical protein [Streptomyces blattellae]
MAEDVRLAKILDLLLSLTEAGRLDWESVGIPRAPKFATSLADASFVVYSKDNDGLSPHILELRNNNGETVETLRTKAPIRRPSRSEQESDAEEEYRSATRAVNLKLRNLYNEARRNAMNVDSFLDSLVDQLESQSREADED